MKNLPYLSLDISQSNHFFKLLTPIDPGIIIIMARGNQRDLARAKNLKKQQENQKNQKKSGDPSKRMESDADKMRRKQAEGMFR